MIRLLVVLLSGAMLLTGAIVLFDGLADVADYAVEQTRIREEEKTQRLYIQEQSRIQGAEIRQQNFTIFMGTMATVGIVAILSIGIYGISTSRKPQQQIVVLRYDELPYHMQRQIDVSTERQINGSAEIRPYRVA